MNIYVMKVEFLDDDDYLIETGLFSPSAKDVEAARDEIADEIERNNELYPSDNYDTTLIDVH